MKRILLLTVFACITASAAQAQFETVTTTTTTTMAQPITESGYINDELVMRAGPDYSYPEIATLPAEENIDIFGCVDGYQWCDVQADGIRGWVQGEYLYLHPYEQPIVTYGPRLTVLPIIVFNRDTYWNRYYRNRSFYHHWYAEHPQRKVIYILPEQTHPRPFPLPRPVLPHPHPVEHDGINVNINVHDNIEHNHPRPIQPITQPVVPQPAAVSPHPVAPTNATELRAITHPVQAQPRAEVHQETHPEILHQQQTHEGTHQNGEVHHEQPHHEGPGGHDNNGPQPH